MAIFGYDLEIKTVFIIREGRLNLEAVTEPGSSSHRNTDRLPEGLVTFINIDSREDLVSAAVTRQLQSGARLSHALAQ